MNKRLILVLICVILLVITGCQTGVQTKNTADNIRSGTQGIVMNFMPNAPPDKVYQGDDVSFIVELKNKGAYPEESGAFEGKLEITGFDQSAIQGSWDGGNMISPNLEGKTQTNIEGGYEVKTFNARVSVPFNGNSYSPKVIVHSCYRYQTIAEPKVCIDPNPYEVVSEKKVCLIKDITMSGQGAPVSVTKIEEDISSENVIFKIYIKNVGGGRVVSSSAFGSYSGSRCPLDLNINDLDKVWVRAELSYDGSPECTPLGTESDPVRLNTAGEGVIRCKFSKPTSEFAFETPLYVQLDYAYSSSIEKTIKIINIK